MVFDLKMPENIARPTDGAAGNEGDRMSFLDSASLENLCAISRVILDSNDWKHTINEVTGMFRSMLIFDNLVVYLKREDDTLDVIHARALGRGKREAADISWGEDTAYQIIQHQEIMLQEPPADNDEERLRHPHILGIPLSMENKCHGALLLIRFGGPAFEPGHIQLTRFVAQQITFLIDHQFSLKYEKLFEDQKQQIQLQKDFISTISHDLRSPLGFIKGYTTTLLREDASWDDTSRREFLTIIDQETDHLQSMIDNLLDSSRLQAGLLKMCYQQIRVDTLVKDMLAREKNHYPQVETEIICNTELFPIQGDPHRLGQVIENLFSNAIKYAPGSKISIILDQGEVFTNIEVKDQGAGIPENYLPYIFERFFRIPDKNSSVHGSGLGLFICKQIIEAHGGKIWAVSQPDKGTSICMQLPNRAVVSE